MNDTTDTTSNPLGHRKISSLLAQFAIPSIIAMVVSSLYNVVDQIFIGQGVGYLGNAATNAAFPLTTICMAITLTIGIGTAARFSLYLGRKEESKAADTVCTGLCMMLIFGILYAVIIELFLKQLLIAFGATDDILDYAIEYTRITAIGMPLIVIMNGCSNIARADGSPMYSMTTMLIGAAVNTILDPIFIFLCNWGVAGAAWATVIGQALSCAFAVRYLTRLKRVRLDFSTFRLRPSQMGRTAVMGMSNGLTQLALTFVQIVMNRSLVHYGALTEYGSNIPLAAAGIVMKVNGIVLAIIIGINQGMQPIIGFNYGARKYSRAREVYLLAVKCELAVTMVGLIIFEAFPSIVLALFGKGEELYMEFAVMFMRVFLMLLPLAGIQMLSSNFFAAIGKPLKGALLSLTRQVFILIPLLIILPYCLGITGVMFAAPLADFIACTIVLIYISREFRAMKSLEKEKADD